MHETDEMRWTLITVQNGDDLYSAHIKVERMNNNLFSDRQTDRQTLSILIAKIGVREMKTNDNEMTMRLSIGAGSISQVLY